MSKLYAYFICGEGMLLKWPVTNLLGYRKSPLYRGIAVWNALDPACRIAKARDTFKHLAKPIVLRLTAEKLRSRGLVR